MEWPTWLFISIYILAGIVLYYSMLLHMKSTIKLLATPFNPEHVQRLKNDQYTDMEIEKMQEVSQALASTMLLLCWVFWPVAAIVEGWMIVTKNHKNR